MSTAHHEPRAAAAHDASDHHDFDGEPVRVLAADEPPTPNWVPALGLALFVVAGITFLAMSGDGAPEAAAAPAHARAAAPAEPRPRTEPAARRQEAQRAAPGGTAAPSAPASANLRKLSPEEVERVRQRMRDARQRTDAPAQAPTPAQAPAPAQ